MPLPFARISLEPLGKVVEVACGTPLRDVLFPFGVEFPCGGKGQCKRCRVRVIAGVVEPTPEDRALFSESELRDGWRLACHAKADGPVTLEVAQMDTSILADDSSFAFTPRAGLGIAVDIGTTTLVAQLLDLSNARVLGVRTALNPQAAHGADIMSRVQHALAGGAAELRDAVRGAVGAMIAELLAGGGEVARIVIVGNSVMHHLFCGFEVEPLSHVPFVSPNEGPAQFTACALGWAQAGNAPVTFLPCLGGFVGSDVLAGVLATRIAEHDGLTGLIDLGTNGEILFGTRDRLVCASAAAGPAFEAGKISMGMRAATGAIAQVSADGGSFACSVIGNVAPRGICGSGLVDAVAAGLDLSLIAPGGRLVNRKPLSLAGDVALTQADVRELQLAKGAVAAGVRIVLNRLGARIEDVQRVYLAGAFGNYVDRASARRIGLLSFPADRIEPSGNTALLGAKLALFSDALGYAALRSRTEHISLAADPEFQEIYVEEMSFPASC